MNGQTDLISKKKYFILRTFLVLLYLRFLIIFFLEQAQQFPQYVHGSILSVAENLKYICENVCECLFAYDMVTNFPRSLKHCFSVMVQRAHRRYTFLFFPILYATSKIPCSIKYEKNNSV